MPVVISLTVWNGLAGRARTGSELHVGVSASSSNGRSNSELTLKFLCRQAQAFHRERLAGGLVSSNQDAVQARVARGGFHSDRHAAKKFIKDRRFSTPITPSCGPVMPASVR